MVNISALGKFFSQPSWVTGSVIRNASCFVLGRSKERFNSKCWWMCSKSLLYIPNGRSDECVIPILSIIPTVDYHTWSIPQIASLYHPIHHSLRMGAVACTFLAPHGMGPQNTSFDHSTTTVVPTVILTGIAFRTLALVTLQNNNLLKYTV